MSDEPEHDEEERPERANLRQIGVGTVSILAIFFGLIVLMCMGSVVILIFLVFRGLTGS